MHVQATLVREVMSSPVIVIQEDASVEEAQALMEEHGIRRLPVLDAEGKLVGIITQGDVREATAVKATINPYAPEATEEWLTVAEAMTPHPITVTPDTPLWQVAELLIENKIGGIPVLDREGNVCGMVTTSDILKLVVDWWRSTRQEERTTSLT